MSRSAIGNIENLTDSIDEQRLRMAVERIIGYLPAQETHLEQLKPGTHVYGAVQLAIDRARKAEDGAWKRLRFYHGKAKESG